MIMADDNAETIDDKIEDTRKLMNKYASGSDKSFEDRVKLLDEFNHPDTVEVLKLHSKYIILGEYGTEGHPGAIHQAADVLGKVKDNDKLSEDQIKGVMEKYIDSFLIKALKLDEEEYEEHLKHIKNASEDDRLKYKSALMGNLVSDSEGKYDNVVDPNNIKTQYEEGVTKKELLSQLEHRATKHAENYTMKLRNKIFSGLIKSTDHPKLYEHTLQDFLNATGEDKKSLHKKHLGMSAHSLAQHWGSIKYHEGAAKLGYKVKDAPKEEQSE